MLLAKYAKVRCLTQSHSLAPDYRFSKSAT